MSAKAKPIAEVDMDTAAYVGSEQDGVYYTVAKGRYGWYASTVIDCNTSHFVDALVTDDGPYASESEAWEAGLRRACSWCDDNDVVYDESDSDNN